MKTIPASVFIGDVRDRERLYRAFDGVDYVVHAAATTRLCQPPNTTRLNASRPTSIWRNERD
jgi:uncharacterized protein YbjT (DUF2867 family)